jgi:hypothetical protein
MTQLELARKEWEDNTAPATKIRVVGKYHKREFKHEFRQYGLALAWLKWDDGLVEIAKIETLQAGKGETKRLLAFMKSIADKHKVRIFGRVAVYEPDPPTPQGTLLSQDQLEDWYGRQGFRLERNQCGVFLWYPDAA